LSLSVVAIFSDNRMDFDIDRNPTVQPSLAEMTQKALDLLSSEASNGFFLMVEGSNIDIAGHENDPVANFHEALAYDAALDVILSYLDGKETYTTVISVSDHETGGLTLGVNNKISGQGQYFWYPSVLLAGKCSATKMASMIQAGQPIAQVLYTYAGLNLTVAEIQAIQNANSSLSTTIIAIGHVISYRAGVGWSTVGHTGIDINLYATGYMTQGLRGNYNNIDIGNWVAKIFNLDLAAQTTRLKDFSPFGP